MRQARLELLPVVVTTGMNSAFNRTQINYVIMKKISSCFIVCIIIAFLMASCENEEVFFDEALLVGKWQSGTLYYKYLAEGTGGTWDVGDDVTEEEAQEFTWTLVESELTHIHILEIGGTVPKVYTMDELTATTLKYHDDFGKNFTFTKVDP